jgi:hypothetical protein
MLSEVVPINVVEPYIVPIARFLDVFASLVAVAVVLYTRVEVSSESSVSDADTDGSPWCVAC